MLEGIGSDISVMARIIEDFGARKKLSRLTLPQMLEKVIGRRESVISVGSDPSYVWWSIINRGEPEIEADMGKMRFADRRKYTIIGEFEDTGAQMLMGNDWANQYCYEDLYQSFMLTQGISYGQKILTRWSGSWYKTSYEYDEYDIETESEIIFTEYVSYVDIPVIFKNPFQKPTASKLRMI